MNAMVSTSLVRTSDAGTTVVSAAGNAAVLFIVNRKSTPETEGQVVRDALHAR